MWYAPGELIEDCMPGCFWHAAISFFLTEQHLTMGPSSHFGILELIFCLSAGVDKAKSGSRNKAMTCQSVKKRVQAGRWSETQQLLLGNNH